MPQRLMSTSQAARALGVSNVTVRAWARAGRLTDHGVTLPGHVRHHGAFLSSEVNTLRARATNVQGGTRDTGRRVRRDVVTPRLPVPELDTRVATLERTVMRLCRWVRISPSYNLPVD